MQYTDRYMLPYIPTADPDLFLLSMMPQKAECDMLCGPFVAALSHSLVTVVEIKEGGGCIKQLWGQNRKKKGGGLLSAHPCITDGPL